MRQVSSVKFHVTEHLIPDTWHLTLFGKSGRRDSNPRISAWKADALPLGDSRDLFPDFTVSDADGQAYTEITARTRQNAKIYFSTVHLTRLTATLNKGRRTQRFNGFLRDLCLHWAAGTRAGFAVQICRLYGSEGFIK